MRLKKLEVAGFKSFMDKTCFTFDSAITAIVGPNGCGKSNIVDAVRWAMGEQSAKALRGQSMEDVIFSGSDVHHPLGMAEVILTFENTNGHTPPELTGCTEIEISRRLFRSGESEYAINRVPCRRRDVWELFMDTGLGNRSYAIVEQDRVSRIIQSKPEERRVVIEEVAGISKYRSRKEAAQRKMDATRQNLLRIQDVRREIGYQIRSLERQAKKAERYRDLRHRILDLERRSHLRTWYNLYRRRCDLDQQRREGEDKRDQLLTDLQVRETALEQDRLDISQKERDLTDAQERLYKRETEVKSLEGRIQTIEQEIHGLETMGDLLEKESRDLGRRIGTGRLELERLTEEKKALNADAVCAEQKTENLRSSVGNLLHERDELSEILEETKVQLVELLSDQARLRNSLNHYQSQEKELERFLGRHRQEWNTLKGRIEKNEKTLLSMQLKVREEEISLSTLQQQRSQISERAKTLSAEYDQVLQDIEKTKGALQEMRSRLQSLGELQDSLEGFTEGVNALRHHSQCGEVLAGKPFKVLAEVMDVPEASEAAVTGLLGDQLQYVVVEYLEDALDAIRFVTEHDLGRVGFVALNGGPGHGATVTEDGNRTNSLEGVQWEPGYEALGKTLLNRVEVVDNASQALEAWRSNGNHPLVTMKGDVLRPPGIFEVGERKGTSTGYLSRKREIKVLQEKIERSAGKEAVQRVTEGELERELASLTHEMEEKQRRIHQTEIALTETRKDLGQIQETLSAAHQRLEILQWEIEQSTEELNRIRDAHQQSANRLGEVESGINEKERQAKAKEEERSTHQQVLEQCQEDLTQAQVKLASMRERSESLQREIQRLEDTVQELTSERTRKDLQREEGTRRTRELRQELEQLGETLSVRMLEHDEAKERLQAFRRDLDEQRGRLQEQVIESQRERKEQRDLEQRLQNVLLQYQELVLRMEHLEGELTGRMEMAARDILEAAEAVPHEDHGGVQQKLAALKASLERLGDVNLMAVEQYEELKERYDFLTNQQEDLEESIRSLNKAIQKINRTSRKRFREAFASLNEQFSRVFPILFEGGEAHLLLTEESDVLEAGVEIVVRPPGKRLQRISLLSGGEKALSAVALIFAMLVIKPTPFCLLDEVDAPLDDANIDRFNDVLKELAKDSQFILVTHNKRTMEMADALYGVTMETPGVSRLISVRLQ